MRLGVILEGPHMPPPDVQRALLTARACSVIAQEERMTPDVRRRLHRLLLTLKRGDEVVVQSLDVFDKTTGELAVLLRNLFEIGVGVRVVAAEDEETLLAPEDPIVALVSLLAEHETRRPVGEKAYRRRRGAAGRRLELTNYQVDYARKLYAEGASPRAIGLLFQATPDEVWQIVGR